jgi:alpha 1,6-mannosyltransferase
LVGERGSDDFVHNHYADNTRILDTFANMPNVGMKSDLLRYLLLQQYGGVYTDTDTIALKPIDDWVPVELRDQVRLVVGIEFDRRDGGAWADISHWVQFCQWTIAAAPGHPVFDIMIERVLQSLQDLSEQHGTPIEELHPSFFEVMNSTGPAVGGFHSCRKLRLTFRRLGQTQYSNNSKYTNLSSATRKTSRS